MFQTVVRDPMLSPTSILESPQRKQHHCFPICLQSILHISVVKTNDTNTIMGFSRREPLEAKDLIPFRFCFQYILKKK